MCDANRFLAVRDIGSGWTGTWDLAGNVREWCANEIGTLRVIVGGGWSDSACSVKPYVDVPGGLPPFDRSPETGLQHLSVAEISVLNLQTRVDAPVFQFNGLYDTDFGFESSALPFFELLGSQNQSLVVEDTGHFVPRSKPVGERLNWLDTHLGRSDS